MAGVDSSGGARAGLRGRGVRSRGETLASRLIGVLGLPWLEPDRRTDSGRDGDVSGQALGRSSCSSMVHDRSVVVCFRRCIGQWGELLESKEAMTMPSDPDQVPDVIVHLLRVRSRVGLLMRARIFPGRGL